MIAEGTIVINAAELDKLAKACEVLNSQCGEIHQLLQLATARLELYQNALTSIAEGCSDPAGTARDVMAKPLEI